MMPHLLSNFEIKNIKTNLNLMVFIQEIMHLIYLDSLYANAENVTHFDSFGVEHIPKEIKKFIGNKNITTNIYRIQGYDLMMCGYFGIGFIDFMLHGKCLLD